MPIPLPISKKIAKTGQALPIFFVKQLANCVVLADGGKTFCVTNASDRYAAAENLQPDQAEWKSTWLMRIC